MLAAAVSYESTSLEINIVRDLIDNHEQLFGVRSFVCRSLLITLNGYCLQCLDTVGWVAGSASGL